MNPADLKPQIEALVRAIGRGDYDTAHAELGQLRSALPGGDASEVELAEAVVKRAFAHGKPNDIALAIRLRDEARARAEKAQQTAPPPAPMPDDPEKARALGALRASATLKDGKLVPAWSAVARELGIPRATLVRWWQTSHFAAPVEGELVERAATVVQGEVEQSMREWIRGPMKRWRQMVDVVTSEKAVARLDKMHDSDPESAARTLVMVTKVLESAPVIARLGDDEGPKGGTALLDRVREQLASMSDGRALLAAK